MTAGAVFPLRCASWTMALRMAVQTWSQPNFPRCASSAPKTGGYAAGNNLGLVEFGFEDVGGKEGGTLSTPRFALLLNPDTVLPPLALADMLAFMDEHPQAGVAGPRLVREDGSLDRACRRSFPTPEVAAYRLLGLSRLFPGAAGLAATT